MHIKLTNLRRTIRHKRTVMAEKAIIVTTRWTISTKPQPSSVPMHRDLPFRKHNVMLIMTHSTPPTLALQVAVVAEPAALGGLYLR